MPGAAGGVHTLQATALKHSVLTGCITATDIGAGLPTELRNSRMRMHVEAEPRLDRATKGV